MAIPKFVKDATTLQFSKGLRYPLAKPIRLTQARDRDAGGGLQVEDLGITNRTRTLIFKNLPLVDYNAAISFYETKAKGALNSFTYHDENGDTMTVLWISSAYNFKETSYRKFAGEIELEIIG
jgi:hypothetical protein